MKPETVEWLRQNLPTEPPEGLIKRIRSQYPEELGGEYIIYSCERTKLPPTTEELMENQIAGKKVWAARCVCTNCGEDFLTRKFAGEPAIAITEGEDGWTYPADIGGAEYLNEIHIGEGNSMLCPTCGAEARLISASRLKGGRTKQIQVCSVQNIGKYTTILYWLVYREISEFGIDQYGAIPRDAFVLAENGCLAHFRKTERNGFGAEWTIPVWKRVKSTEDTEYCIYHDWGSICSRKNGSAYDREIPDLTGHTGEKTGLQVYMREKRAHPVKYLKLWKKEPGIENLVNAGQGLLIEQILEEPYMLERAKEILHIQKRKPHEMLGVGKDEFRVLQKVEIKVTVQTWRLWRKYKEAGGRSTVPEFYDFLKKGGDGAIWAGIDLKKQYGHDLEKVERYLTKRGLKARDTGLLLDARRLAKRLAGGRPLTQEELWPRRLRETHDRLAEEVAAKEKTEKAKEYQKGFDKILETYGALQWTDGELCIQLPKSLEELQEEGRVLRHCVGGYGNRHITGKDTIFFVRHYRRPERNYYTLDICMADGEPHEVQLHGYGNEHHGENKQYRHEIPRKVRDFVDRWKKEVLLPWYRKKTKKEKKIA